MSLPPFEPNLLPEGHYRFQITKEPEKRRGEKNGIYLIFVFRAISDSGSSRRYSDVFVPWEERYKDLLLALGGEADEKGQVHLGDIDVTGKQFEADIVHIKDPRDPTKVRDKIANIVINDDVPPPDEPIESEDEVPF